MILISLILKKMLVRLFCKKCDDIFEKEVKIYEEIPNLCDCCEESTQLEDLDNFCAVEETARILSGIERGII